ncbi:PST family polysaccharide transporter [Weissella beninensis]|uniref:Polysaccharide biosynthesis protein n=1 Tax=Periweissella beninensis TaxID=504936 RepID=A0ABT0VJ38_9LACO|nr:polysaccharide biosynthesis protein [Periweissella beninensis]MBM7544386.1 PST family polysaccharide transporter [Periweissella beninensis]MCM2437848.1 polysaccharide biosynthesis protein [Periweissella beninensis]
MSNRQIIKGALILSTAGVVAKILSAIYRIPLENFVGNTGFYVYQQVYPIYGLGMTLALNGLPVFISKLISEKATLTEQLVTSKIIFKYLMVLGVGLWAGLMLGSSLIAKLMGDVNLAHVIMAVSWMFLFLPILATGRGLAQGQHNMRPTAFSQVIEQIVRVLIIIGVAYLAMKLKWNVYFMGMLAMLSAPIAGGVASLFFIKNVPLFLSKTISSTKKQRQQIKQRLLTEGILVSSLVGLLLILQLIDSFTVRSALISSGIPSEQAKAVKGIYDRAQPLVQFGLVLATGFATSSLPSLRRLFLNKAQKVLRMTIMQLLKVTAWLAIMITMGLISLMPQINQLLFGTRTNSWTLAVYMLTIISMSLLLILTSILQSIEQTQSLEPGLIIAIGIKGALNTILVEKLGIMGASITTVCALVGMLSYIWFHVYQQLLLNGPLLKSFMLKLVGQSLLMLVVVRFITTFLEQIYSTSRSLTLVTIIIATSIGASISGYLLFKTKLLTVEEIEMLPLGKKILKLR